MSVSTIHVLHGLRLPSGAFLSELTNARISTAMEDLIGLAAGHPYPLFTGAHTMKPEISGRSPAIETLLTATGLTGLDTSAGNTDFYLKKATDLGIRVANATTGHLRFRATQGLLITQRITARHGQIAEAEFRYLPTWDGTNNPLVAAGSVALAGAEAGAEWFTLGPVSFNSVQIPGVEEVTYDFGIALYEEGSDGEPYLTFAGVKELNPVMVTVRTKEATVWTSYTAEGTALANFTGYLRAKAQDGINEANATAAHVKFTNSLGGRLVVDNSEGGGNELVSNQVRILFRCDAEGEVPLTIALNQAIT